MRNRAVRGALIHSALFLAILAPGLGALSLEQALARVDKVPAVRSALLTVEHAQKELQSLSFPGSPALSLEPQLKATTREWEPFAEEVAVSAAATARFFPGLSAVEREQVRAAEDAVAAARGRLEQARAEGFVQIYSLYQAAGLAQEEQAVLAAELEAARVYAENLSERFRVGEVSLVELSEAQEDFDRKAEALLEGGLRVRLSWLELAFAVEWELTLETPRLAPEIGSAEAAALPRPPELVAWAAERDPELRALTAEMARLDETRARLAKSDLSFSLRGFGSVADHIVSVSYAFTDPLLSVGYTARLYTLGEIPLPGGSRPTWDVGLSVGVSYTGGKTDRLAIETLEAARRQLVAQHALRRQALELGIRGQYLQWLKATQSLEQGRRNLQRAQENQRLLESKRSLGLVSEQDLLMEEALLQRARWSVLAGEVEQRRSALAVAASASYLGEIVGGLGEKQ